MEELWISKRLEDITDKINEQEEGLFRGFLWIFLFIGLIGAFVLLIAVFFWSWKFGLFIIIILTIIEIANQLGAN